MTTFRPADAAVVDAGADARDLDAIRDWVNAMPLAQALALECTAIEPGRSEFVMRPPESWRNPNGSIAGAAFLGATDYAAGMAAVSVTGAADYVSTVDLGLHFLRPAMHAPLTIRSTVLKRGGRLIFLQNEVEDAEGAVVAAGVGSFSVLRSGGLEYPIGTQEGS